MQDIISQFRNSYADRFADGMSEFLKLHGQTIIRRLHRSITKSRRSIYIFGNGGSHAISKCIEYALQKYATGCGLPLRVQTGIDTHKISSLATDGNPGMSFVSTLKMEGADARDLIILISGSGNSDNLCDVADYAKDISIPTIAVVGSNQGKLRDFISPAHFFCVPLEDQQISEDIIQSLAYFLDQSVSGMQQANWDKLVSSQAEGIRQAIQQIPASFINAIGEALFNTFSSRKFVWMLGFNHPVLSVCAEHTAHNLYWDSIYEVDNPPRRVIFSSPTACDFSGISNDRRKRIIEKLAGINEPEIEGVALLYSMKLDHQVEELLESLDQSHIPTFLFSANTNLTQSYRNVVVHNTRLEKPQTQAGISQILGHILGRIVRMKLIERSASQNNHIVPNPTQFLIDFDLAQRRLLDG